jgi:ubiquitin-like-conjugating enzyme ATG3
MSNKNISYSMFSMFKSLAEYVTPVKTASAFYDKGTLTPEEFVLAGDLLVSKCPTWKWCAGDPAKAKPYLPPQKQYLKTMQVPCLRRASDLLSKGGAEDEAAAEDDWTNTFMSHASSQIEDIPSINGRQQPKSGGAAQAQADDDIPDMESFDEADNLVADEADDGAPDHDAFVRSRTYDLSITYDKYYQTPRLWLFGYSEDGQPLTPEQVLEDIYADYANKTVTMEAHPHESGVHCASIHPCRHASVMKKMVDNMAEDGEFVRVDLYLFLFLKFMSAVIPTISYDFTVAM